MDTAVTFRPSPADTEDTAVQIAALAPWSQNILLPDGTETASSQPAANRAARQWEQIQDFLPADLTGFEALVINGNAGHHALMLAKRGAHVTLLDENSHFLRQARWVASRHGIAHQIELLRGHVNHLATWRGRPDVVLWLDGLHTLRYPLLGLDIIAQLARRCLILGLPSSEADVEYEGTSGVDEHGAWWAFDETLSTLLRSAGFDHAAAPGPGLFVCQPVAAAARKLMRTRTEFLAVTGGLPTGLARFEEDLSIGAGAIAPLAIATA